MTIFRLTLAGPGSGARGWLAQKSASRWGKSNHQMAYTNSALRRDLNGMAGAAAVRQVPAMPESC
jgi:hypothetical protein